MADRNPLRHDQLALAVPSPGRTVLAPGDVVLIAEVRDELRTGFGALAAVERGVSVFGSARTRPEDPDYELARAVAARLGRDGFAIITGGGAGIMEAANRGARDADALSIGLSIALPLGERMNRYVDLPLRFQYVFTRKVMFARYA
jgi:predicted Rossmann-fold nucleotide-binding protein